MSTCTSIEPLVTPYVDGEISPADRSTVDEHLHRCAPCWSRVAAESAVRDLVRARKPDLAIERAPASLRERCGSLALRAGAGETGAADRRAGSIASVRGWWPRIVSNAKPVPLALAASLVLLVAGAFLYQATHYSAKLLAAELAADHMKCFAAASLLGTKDQPAAVESSMMSAFGWQLHLPEQLDTSGYELVGSRRCLYAEGRVAHLMYRDEHGRPVSIFMLPKRARAEELVEALGHEAAIWSSGGRTFVLVTRGSPAEVQRMATFVKAALQ